jgi:halocyanin-like protein
MSGTPETELTRRGVVRGAAVGLAGAVGVGAATGPAAGQSTFDGWLDGVSNYDRVVDETGSEEVQVIVGAEANGGNLGFGPAAIRVSPGTTVVWRWNGKGGAHNVVANDGSFESELTADQGFTFRYTFEEPGTTKYYCQPHQTIGMKGVVVVEGEGGAGAGAGGGGEGATTGPSAGVATTFQALSGVLAGAFALVMAATGYVYGRYREPEPTGTGAGAGSGTGPGAGTGTADVPAAGETAPAGTAVEATATDAVRELGHDEFDPTGTAALLVAYFLIIALMWVFMYFVEFLGNGPTVIG